MTKTVRSMIRLMRRSVISIQAAWRGYRARVQTHRNLIDYFRSIGQLELTMSNQEKR